MSSPVAKIRMPAKSYGKCCQCGEKWSKDERMFILKFEDAKDKKICRFCSEDEYGYMTELTQGDYTRLVELEMASDAERSAERRAEEYARYRAAGCASEWFRDQD